MTEDRRQQSRIYQGIERNGGERFTGHGSEWTDANLSKEDAHVATVWVDQIINKRSMLTNKDRVEDVRDAMWELEKDGEIVVHRVGDEHEPVTVKTLYGWDKKVPTSSSGTTSPAASAATSRATRRRCCG